MRGTLLTLILIISVASYGQGYRGKRFSFSYQPGYSMVNYLSLQFVQHHKASFGFAAGKHLGINLHGSFSKSNIGDVYYNDAFIKDISGGVSLLFYRKMYQCTAPNGRYMGLVFDYGVQNSLRKVEVDSDPGNPWNTSTYTEYFYDDVEPITMTMASAIFGRNFILKERYLLGYGIQWGIVLQREQPIRHLAKPFFNLGIIF